MNTLRSYLLIITGAVYLLLLSICFHSCSLEKCLGVKCVHGACVKGTCNCNAGYEGPSCDTIIRNKFLGVFNVTSTCFTNEGYGTIIDYVSTSNYTQVNIENMSDLRITVTANIVGTLGLDIPPQTETGGGQTWVISGSAEMMPNHNTVILQMSYYDASNKVTNSCTETYVRKTQ